jgi:hypothetical protein
MGRRLSEEARAELAARREALRLELAEVEGELRLDEALRLQAEARERWGAGDRPGLAGGRWRQWGRRGCG